ncbi:hypothetical protein AMJ80_07875 [bacterium SM23_31]|nr:MAG: hypothetical protein AMJ80_07875 [bacterium SM23_31]
MKYLIIRILDFYMIIILIRVLISWIRINPNNPFVEIIYKLTEPVLAPIRSVLPYMGGIDISPLIVFIIYTFLISLL